LARANPLSRRYNGFSGGGDWTTEYGTGTEYSTGVDGTTAMLDLQLQGEMNALNLIDDTQYELVYEGDEDIAGLI
jgi:hypothetical protein